MGVLALFELLRDFKFAESIAAPVAGALVVIAPIIMGFQGFDDHSRAKHTGSRDYANNFLESCDKNAIIFTYGDNDTYPLWYAQEVEGIRRDVRVVNLSLIAVDWYIDNLRRKINESPAVKMSMNPAAYRGYKRNQLPIDDKGNEMSITDLIKFLGEEHPVPIGQGEVLESYAPTRKIYIPIDKQKVIANHIAGAQDSIVDRMNFNLSGSYLIKDDMAVLDIIANNIHERPIYFAVTCRPEKMQGLDNYMQLEGLATRMTPVLSKSDQAFGPMMGAGRVAPDKIYDRVMNKFRWGNFDKEKTFISKNYAPSVQTTQFSILRAVQELINTNQKDKAAQLLDKMFAGFPNFNFPYAESSIQTLYFLDAYVKAEAYDKGKKHFQILADGLLSKLNFYNSLSADDRAATFQQDQMMDMQAKEQLIRLVEQAGDSAYKQELEQKFAAFKIEGILPGAQ
jgi:hypothetical protein